MRRANDQQRFEDPVDLLSRGLTKLHSIWVSLIYPFASRGRNLSIHFTSQLNRQRASRISLGNSIIMKKGTWLNVADENCTGEPAILIEDGCCICADSIISAKNRIHLERDVLVSQSVLIMDHNHAYEDITVPIVRQGITEGGRIRIGQGSWIGHGAAVMCSSGELTIGRHCVVAANSVVVRSIPPYSVVGGIPARIIKQYDPVKRAWCAGSNDGATARKGESTVPSATVERSVELIGNS